jgi:hypothetical protein
VTDIAKDLRARHANVTGNDPRITQPIVGPTIFLEAAQEIDRLRRERDSIRRTFCFIIASGNLNARDGNTAFRIGAEWVAELNHWKCFEENN